MRKIGAGQPNLAKIVCYYSSKVDLLIKDFRTLTISDEWFSRFGNIVGQAPIFFLQKA